MSLRARVVALIGLILIFGVLLGALSAGLQARRTLAEELRAGLTGGEQTVLSAFEDLPRSDHAERDLDHLIATFDGNRHVRAILTGPGGQTVRTSALASEPNPPPDWFVQLLGQPPADEVIPAPAPVQNRAIRLVPAADIDASALWIEVRGIVLSLSLSAAVGFVLVWLVIDRALAPLRALSAGFARIGGGDYQVQVQARGPSEIAALQRGFNGMVERLAAMRGRTRALEEQLLTLQDEERADLARDLHDEIGPHLFAVNVAAEVAGRLVEDGQPGQIPPHIRSIQASVGHMQRLVREILGRLRPSRATELGLNAAVLDLVVFWRARAPQIAIACDLLPDEDILDEPVKDTIYRVIQEGLNNAVRHASAERIDIRVARYGEDGIEVQVEDDGAAAGPAASGGFGLIGMRERVDAAGGTLTIDAGKGKGWRIIARLPLRARAQAA